MSTKDRKTLVKRLRARGDLSNAAATEIEVLRNNLNTALSMLADWCVSTQDPHPRAWEDCYMQAAHRDGPLRSMLDKAIVEARGRRTIK